MKIAYAISIGDKEDYEYNVADEILLFDNYEQIATYAKVNNIDFDQLYVHEVEVE